MTTRIDDKSADNEKETGLPGLRTWPAVYAFVTAVFVAYVTLMLGFSRWLD